VDAIAKHPQNKERESSASLWHSLLVFALAFAAHSSKHTHTHWTLLWMPSQTASTYPLYTPLPRKLRSTDDSCFLTAVVLIAVVVMPKQFILPTLPHKQLLLFLFCCYCCWAYSFYLDFICLLFAALFSAADSAAAVT